MGLSARVPVNAGTNFFIPAIYANQVIDAAKSQLVAWDAIWSSWSSNLAKGNILYIPKTNVVAATEVTVGSKASATDPLATTGVTLTINQWYEAPVDIDYMTIRQTQADIGAVASLEAAYAVQKAIDTYICAIFDDLGGYSTTAYGTDGQTLTDDILLYCKETLDEADVPMDDNRSLILDPSALVDMLKIDKFVARDYVNIGAINNGIIGKSPIYGCTVRVTNNLTQSAGTVGNVACMLHKKAIVAAAQIDTAWTKEYEDLHLRRYQAEALYGASEAQDAWGVPFYTRKT